ncbi:MAG: flagellar hook-length control protein FliK, partial [Thiobacillaceae bacterium]
LNLSALPELLISWLRGQGTGALQPQRGQDVGALSFRPGQQYDGQVLESLGNGRSLVRVGKEVLDMALPREQASPGQTLRLTYVASNPRPTFLLVQTAAAGGGQPVRLSEAAQQVNALIRLAQTPASAQPVGPSPAAAGSAGTPVPTGAATAATAPSSSIAQAGVSGSVPGQRPIVSNVSLLLNHANPAGNLSAALASRTALPAMAMAGQAVDGLRAALAAGTDLATQGVAQAALASQAVLPQRLRQVVRESGMFYESHLARWNKGELSLESLLREPQARLGQAGLVTTELPELQQMPEEAARLAGRQLMMLEGGPFVWQGQVWPGQWMQWRVEEREQGRAGAEEGACWQTELELILPRLGRVSAELTLSAQGLRLQLNAGSETALAELRAALPQLAASLHAAGLEVQAVSTHLVDADAGSPQAA